MLYVLRTITSSAILIAIHLHASDKLTMRRITCDMFDRTAHIWIGLSDPIYPVYRKEKIYCTFVELLFLL